METLRQWLHKTAQEMSPQTLNQSPAVTTIKIGLWQHLIVKLVLPNANKRYERWLVKNK
jgi:hypothetical protein